MPSSYPPAFREHAVELARQRDKPVAQIANDRRISETCLRRWKDRVDVEDGVKPCLSGDERRESATGDVACKRDLVPKANSLEVTSGGYHVWSSDDVCATSPCSTA
jgi:transposase-like protein